jgi:hypothetical protein
MLPVPRLMLSTSKPLGSSQRLDMNAAIDAISSPVPEENRPASSRVRQSPFSMLTHSVAPHQRRQLPTKFLLLRFRDRRLALLGQFRPRNEENQSLSICLLRRLSH